MLPAHIFFEVVLKFKKAFYSAFEVTLMQNTLNLCKEDDVMQYVDAACQRIEIKPVMEVF